MTADTREALKKARDAGHIVAFITGRRLLQPLTPIFSLGDYVILNNGGTVVQIPEGKIVSQRLCRREDMLRLITFCNARRLPLHMVADDYWGVNEPSGLVGELVEGWQRKQVFYRDASDLPFQTLDGFMVTGPRCGEIKDFVAREGLELFCLQSEPELVDIMPAGVNKWSGADYLAKLHHILRENIIGAGNYFNDLELILGAGVGVAVQNAPAEVKAQADYVTRRTNLEGAVAEIINKFVFPEA